MCRLPAAANLLLEDNVIRREHAMPIAIVMEFEGATLEQYDQVIEKMGFEPGGPGAPGGLSHWVAATEDGIRVTDVWESRALFDQFAQEQIGPLTASVGIPAPPELTFHDVHNHLTAGPVHAQK
jgi:hypothetical protein